MTVTLSWPTSLPLPTMNGYGIDDQPRMIRTPMEAGTARQRRTSTQAPAEVSARWVFTLYEYGFFEAWLEHDAKFGANWFNITYLGGAGLVACVARVKDGKAPVKFQNGAIAVVTATLEIRERPKLSKQDLDLLINEDGAALLAAISSIHVMTVTILWPALDDDPTAIGEDVPPVIAAVYSLHPIVNGLWTNP